MTTSQLDLFGEASPQSTAAAQVLVRSHMKRIKGAHASPDAHTALTAPAVHNGTATSRAAARAADESGARVSDYHKVLAAIQSAGERGLTRTEIARVTGVSPDSVRPRVAELMGRSKGLPVLIEERGERVPEGSSRQQAVLVAIERCF